jgi:hypothetical protein
LKKLKKIKQKFKEILTFLKKQSLEIDKQQSFLNQRIQTLKGLEKKL